MLTGNGPSWRKVEEPGDGLDCGRPGNEGRDGEELKLIHKEVMGLLKSALQAGSDVKEVGNMENEFSGVAGVFSAAPKMLIGMKLLFWNVRGVGKLSILAIWRIMQQNQAKLS